MKCPKCDTEFKIDASIAFTENASVECEGCHKSIVLDNQQAIIDVKKQLNNLKDALK